MDKFLTKPLSWSQISSFEWNPEEWYKRYILKEKQEESAAMKFGKSIGESLASDPTFMPEVPRLPIFEKKLEARIGKINLVGFLDSFDENSKEFYEYKTSSNKKKWTKKSSQEHGQLLMYKFLIWLNYQTPPEKVKSTLFYIPCEETGDFAIKLSNEKVQSFEVKHSSSDVLNFGVYIKSTYQKMLDYIKSKE